MENEYEKRLDELFLNNPTNPDYLELELLSGDINKSAVYLYTHIDYNALKTDSTVFGKTLMRLLRPIYNSMDIKSFGDYMFSVWESIPGYIQNGEPFFSLCYADNPLSWGDTEQAKSIYEKMLNYYD